MHLQDKMREKQKLLVTGTLEDKYESFFGRTKIRSVENNKSLNAAAK